MSVQLLWDEAVGRLRSRVTSQYYDMWLRPIEVSSFDGSTLRLRAPNSYIRAWFETNFLTSLLTEIRELGHHAVQVQFDPDGPDERPSLPSIPTQLPPAPGSAVPPIPAPPS